MLKEPGLQPCLPSQCAEWCTPLLLGVWLEANQVKINKRRGERNGGGSGGENCTQHGASHLWHSAMLNHPTSGHQMPHQSSWPGLNICHGPWMNISSKTMNRPPTSCASALSLSINTGFPQLALKQKAKQRSLKIQQQIWSVSVHVLVQASHPASLNRVPQA